MLDFIIDAARAESHMLEAAVNEEHRDWHQQQAWGLMDRVNEAQKIHPWLAMEVLGLDVMRLLLKGHTRQALELVESGEQVLEMQGARITMGRLCMRLAQGLKADGQSDWRDWAAKALSQFEMAGASPHASAARRMLELEPAAQTLAVQESSAASTAAHRAMDENSLAVQMLEHLGHALNGGDGGAADAMQRTFLRASMEAVNAEFGLLLLPDGLGRLASALSIPEHLGAPQQEIPQQETQHQEIEQQETPHQETEQRKTAQQETEQPEKQQPREVNQWLVEQVWRQGKGEVMELFHPRSESAAGTAIGPEAQSAICIPLKSGETTHGVVYLGSAAERLRFDESDLSRVLRMARQAGTAVAYGAALESASGESRRVQAEISHLRDSAEWCPPAAAKQDCGEILKEYLDKCAAPAGFTGALLYWRKGDGAQLELGARASSGEELEFPAEYGVLDCWGTGRTAALALQSRRPMWMAQNPNDASDDSTKSMSTALDFRSGLWMPFPVSSDPAGVLLLTAPVELPRDLDSLGNSLELPLRLICPSLLQLRQLAGLDEAKAALQERAKKAEADNQRLARFVPAYLRGARTAKDDAKLIGEEKRLPVASGQIFGLGRLANVGKQETLAELQACYQKISEALAMHQGNLEQIMGDRWIAQYNGSVDSALWGVLTLIGNLTDFQEQRKASGLPELSFGIGLHLGDTIGGVLETDQRIEPVLVGEGVQVAARLAGMCRNFRTPVLVSDQTVQALDDVSPFDLRSLGLFRTAPGENRIGVYELYSTRSPEIRQAMRKHQGDWNAAMRHYRNGEWSDGAALFKAYLAKFPQDRPGRHFLRYCRQRAGQP